MDALHEESDQIFEYFLELLGSRWRLLATCVLTAAGLTFAVTKYLVTPYYRATALLRPISEQSSASEAQGRGPIAALGGVLGLDAEGRRAQEYISILRSYQFTLALVDGHNLRRVIDPLEVSLVPSPTTVTQWQLYNIMAARFDCKYDQMTGNLRLYFVDPDPTRARHILKLYIDALRDKLRRGEVQNADTAIESLTDEVQSIPDALLQNQLYELLARQIQRKKLAQVEADFAFNLIDPPMVPDRPYTPNVKFNSLLAAVLSLLLVVSVIVAHDWWSRLQRRGPLPSP